MTVLYEDIKWPSPSNIISDSTPKEWLAPWASLECQKWIEERCELKNDHYLLPKDKINEMRWSYKEKSSRALDVGSQVHDAIRMYLMAGTKPSNPDDQVKTAFNAFLDFEKQHEMKTLEMERRIFADNWCGMFDWYGEFDGKFTVIDFKTSSVFSREMRIQTAAYRYLILLKDPAIEANAVIRLDKESGIPEYKDYSKTYEDDIAEFMIAKELYFRRHPRIAKQFHKPF